jgi:hypothetical protein
MNESSLRALDEVKYGNLNTYKDVDEMFDKLGIKIMNKYRRLPIEVTAEQYNGPDHVEDRESELYKRDVPGQPKGVYWSYITIGGDEYSAWYPFVDSDSGLCQNRQIGKPGFIVQNTDWIITKQDGERIVVSDDEFKREYEEIV